MTLQALHLRPKPGELGIVVRLAGSPLPHGHGAFEAVLRFGRRRLLPQMREQVFCRVVDGVNSQEHSGQIMTHAPSPDHDPGKPRLRPACDARFALVSSSAPMPVRVCSVLISLLMCYLISVCRRLLFAVLR